MARTYSSTTLKLENLVEFDTLTQNQTKAKESWKSGQNLVLSGSAGTGKTFLGMRLGIEEVLDRNTEYEQLIVVRSIVPTRDMGFLPGLEEKLDPYKIAYQGLLQEMFNDSQAWDKLVKAKKVEFVPTSFLRGVTWNNSIVLVDEMQNLNFHELDSVITRIGRGSKMIFAGDYYQSDFEKENEKSGILEFMGILEDLHKFDVIEFTWKDIVRSDFVRDYIMTKEMKGIK